MNQAYSQLQLLSQNDLWFKDVAKREILLIGNHISTYFLAIESKFSAK